MVRIVFALIIGAVLGAVAINPIRELVQDQLLQPVEAISLGLVAAAAALVGVLILILMPERVFKLEPRWETTLGASLADFEPVRPAPPTGGSGVRPSHVDLAKAKLLLAKAELAEAQRRQLEPLTA